MTVHFEVTDAGFTLKAIVDRQNQDLLIQLIGGDVPHYGVVTVVGPETAAQTIAMPSRPGHHHEEGYLTKRLASYLQPVLQSNAFIVSGVHINRISNEQMKAMAGLVQALAEQIIAWLKTHPAEKVVEEFS